MKIIFSLAFLCLYASLSFAELAIKNNGKIHGNVRDTDSRLPIEFATVTLYSAKDSSIIGGTIADKNGKFELTKIPVGSYTLEVTFLGYENISRQVAITKKNKNASLGDIFLITSSYELEEIEVTRERSTIEQKIDRKVINVGKDLVSAGANALAVLTHVPSINVDQDENVSMRGNENVRILIDGKPTHIEASELLKQIPSSSIKTIELITNPSAKYSPEGMSGIINITLKKNTQLGFNGSVNVGYRRNTRNKFDNSINFNYRKGKVNLFANIGLDIGEREFRGRVVRNDIQLYRTLNFNNDGLSNLYKLGFDILFDKKNTFSFYTNQRIRNNNRKGMVYEDYRLPENDTLDVTQHFAGKFENYSQTYNANFKHNFTKKGHFIVLEANFNKTKRENDSEYTYTGKRDLSDYRDIGDRQHTNQIYNLDYTNRLSKNTKLEMGLESRIRKTENDYSTNSENFEDVFYTYNRYIHSFYTSLNFKVNKVKFQTGLRLETYEVEAIQDNVEVYEDDYFTAYPSFFITYVPLPKNQFQLSYSRRVDRPGLRQVNPIKQWSSPAFSSFGNPELKPQFTNSYEFNYTRQLKNGSITTGIFYRKIIDEITRSISIDPNDEYRTILSYNNLGKNDAYGIEVSGRYEIRQWWNLNGSFDYYSRTLKGVVATENVTVDENIANLRLSNEFKATKNLRFQLFGMYRGAHQNLQFQLDPIWKIDLGARYNLWKGKGTLSARFSDIFDTFRFGFNTKKPYIANGKFRWGAQSFYIGFTYNFGEKTKSRRRKSHNLDNQRDNGGGFF